METPICKSRSFGKPVYLIKPYVYETINGKRKRVPSITFDESGITIVDIKKRAVIKLSIIIAILLSFSSCTATIHPTTSQKKAKEARQEKIAAIALIGAGAMAFRSLSGNK